MFSEHSFLVLAAGKTMDVMLFASQQMLVRYGNELKEKLFTLFPSSFLWYQQALPNFCVMLSRERLLRKN